jgi:hypothetical protein
MPFYKKLQMFIDLYRLLRQFPWQSVVELRGFDRSCPHPITDILEFTGRSAGLKRQPIARSDTVTEACLTGCCQSRQTIKISFNTW